MNSLNTPIEAIVLNYYNYDALAVIINNLWTWIAVFTAGAGISFVLTVKSPPGKVLPEADPVVCFHDPDPSPVERSTASVAAPESGGGVVKVKEKFTEYFYEERDIVWDEDEDNDEEEEECVKLVRVDGDGDGALKLVNEWEYRENGIRTGMGWYRYQDLTVFNGNVVKLWGTKAVKMDTVVSGGY